MSEELNEIFELLRKEKFTIISDFDEYFKCTICKEILVNAHQTSCGCNFCQVCINNYIINGQLNCPGNKTDCKSINLSKISVNSRINKQISFLKVQCPYTICSYECELNQMENHMKFCTRKYVNCPFNNAGCESRETNNDKLNEHMLLEIVNHNKILIDIIGNLRNEIHELNEKVVRNRNEIEILKKEDSVKNETIQFLMKEIDFIKETHRNYVEQSEMYNRNLIKEINKINIEIENNCKFVNDKTMKTFDEILNYRKVDNPNKDKIDKNELSENNLKNEINEINKYLNMCDGGELLWQIGKITNLSEWMWSEYFYDRQNPYKMQLILCNKFEDLRIGLRISSGNFDADLKWPCQANMTIMFGESGKYEKPFNKSIFIETIDSNPFENDNYIIISTNEYKISMNFYKSYNLICKVKFI